MGRIWRVYIVVLIWCVEWSAQDTEIVVLKKIFGSHTDMRTIIPPKVNESTSDPLPVFVYLMVRNIDKLDDRNMEIKMQLVLRMLWQDRRLSYEYIDELKKQPIDYVSFTDTSKIWVPDVFFTAEKQAHDHNIVVPNTYVRVFPNGTVIYSRRISLTLSCLMDLSSFPFDRQTCYIRLGSYKSDSRFKLQWMEPDAFQIIKNLHITHFELSSFETRSISGKTATGDYHILVADLQFTRDYSYYLRKYYVPVLVVVFISWIPLWLQRVLILRIFLAFSTVIYLGWLYAVQDVDLLVSYSTGIDSWNVANFVFVLLAGLESILITFMIKTNMNAIKRTHPDDSDEFKMIPTGSDKRKIYEVCEEKTDLDVEVMKIKTNFKICFINVHKEVLIIDTAAQLFFPSSYILFLFFYWINY